MKKRIFIVYPPKQIFDKLKNNENYIFYKNWSLIYFDKKLKKNISTSIKELPIESNALLFDNNIRNLVTSMQLVLERWLRGMSDLDILRNNIIINIAKIKQFLKKHNVEKTIFYSASPHHVETAIISCCVSSLNIPEYFFKKHCFGALMIKGSVLFSKRSIPQFSQTDYNLNDEISNFVSNLSLNLPPKKTGQKRNWWKKNFLICLGFGIIITLREYYILLFKDIDKICLKQHTFKRVFYDMLNQKKFIKNYYQKELKNINIDEYNGGIIIIAHMQPEATVVPEGGMYSSNLDLILKFRSLGFKKDIFYKEHNGSLHYFNHSVGPTGVGGYRSKKYLNDLFSLNVKLLPINKYISKNTSNWIATITGTVAIERSLLGLKTIVAGEPWYKGLPGTISINEITLDQLNEIPPKPDLKISEDARLFLISKMNRNYLPQLPEIVNEKVLDLHLNYFDQILKHR